MPKLLQLKSGITKNAQYPYHIIQKFLEILANVKRLEKRKQKCKYRKGTDKPAIIYRYDCLY